MKTSKFVSILCVAVALTFCVTAQAQNDSKSKVDTEKVKKDAVEKVSKGKPVEGAQAKIAEIKEMYMAKIANAKTDEEKAALKEKMYQEIEKLQGNAGASTEVSKGDASTMSDLDKKIMEVRKEYAKKMENAANDKERGKLRAEMHEIVKELRGGSSSSTSTGAVSKEGGSVSKNDGPVAKDGEARGDAKSDGNSSGAVRPTEKLKAAESKLVKSQNSMSQGMKTIEKARARVNAAKEKLQSDIDAGDLSKDDIMKREEKIRSVENQINVLEAAVNKAKDVNTNAGKRLNSLDNSEN